MNREYMDKGICALDGVMICFSDHRETVRVPARAGDMPLHRLGSGALCLPRARQVILEEGYTAVSGLTLPEENRVCTQITLPSTLETCDGFQPGRYILPSRLNLRRDVSENEFSRYLMYSEPAGQGFRLLNSEGLELPSCALLLQILKGYYGRSGVVNEIHPQLPLFFTDRNPGKNLNLPISCMSHVSQKSALTENECVLQRISGGDMGARSAEAERANDRRDQSGYSSGDGISEVTLIGFSREAAMHRKGRVYMTLTAMTGIFFNQMLRRVVLDGTDYYVYSRRFLAGTKDGYLREDVCVYGRDGMITDRKLSGSVYGKYRFLNML